VYMAYIEPQMLPLHCRHAPGEFGRKTQRTYYTPQSVTPSLLSPLPPSPKSYLAPYTTVSHPLHYTTSSFISHALLPHHYTATTMSKPTNFDLIKEAILALKDRTGSSPAAIKVYLGKQHPTIPLDHQFFKALKAGVTAGKLIKVRRTRGREKRLVWFHGVGREDGGSYWSRGGGRREGSLVCQGRLYSLVCKVIFRSACPPLIGACWRGNLDFCIQSTHTSPFLPPSLPIIRSRPPTSCRTPPKRWPSPRRPWRKRLPGRW